MTLTILKIERKLNILWKINHLISNFVAAAPCNYHQP